MIDPGQMLVSNKDQPVYQKLRQFREMFLNNFGSGKYLIMFCRFHITTFLSEKHGQLSKGRSLIIGIWILTQKYFMKEIDIAYYPPFSNFKDSLCT